MSSEKLHNPDVCVGRDDRRNQKLKQKSEDTKNISRQTRPLLSTDLDTVLLAPLTTLKSAWSTLIGRGMSRLVSHWSRYVAPPALLCHKEPARRIQSPLLGASERKIRPLGGILLPPRWFFMA